MFTLAISCLTTPNLPWFMDLTSRFLCNVVLYSFQLFFHHQSHPQLGIVFALTQPLLSVAISPFFSSSILGTYQPGEFTFSVISFCLLIVFMVFSRQEYWSGLPFPSPVGRILKNTEVVCLSLLPPPFCQNSPPWPVHLQWLHMAWLIVSPS